MLPAAKDGRRQYRRYASRSSIFVASSRASLLVSAFPCDAADQLADLRDVAQTSFDHEGDQERLIFSTLRR
jgi:hypothetical protein